ncbi:transporter substrate-binding domain-containing protein [Oceanobacter mangrovi]|uniref:transporter substrate-binding domain-containing protein n=1 Tax=Oceanobacter mangrovi TaxID=2862510 RepID=UPI001C8E562E|nr:transporter substrate-binding domain-containing protein [Oceanobacter mangrovi]
MRYWLLLLVAAAAVLLASMGMVQQQPQPFVLRDYLSASCELTTLTKPAPQQQQTERLSILLGSSLGADKMLEILCRSELLAQQFAGIDIIWRYKSFLSAQHIIEQQYDVMWGRDYALHGLVPDLEQYYGVLASTAPFKVYWLSKGRPVALTPEYLADKKIGVLAGGISQTFYLQPITSLQHAGLDAKTLAFREYNTLPALYQAFESGEVDIIPTPLWLLSSYGVHYDYALLLEPAMPGANWYIKSGLLSSTKVACELYQAVAAVPFVSTEKIMLAGDLRCD